MSKPPKVNKHQRVKKVKEARKTIPSKIIGNKIVPPPADKVVTY